MSNYFWNSDPTPVPPVGPPVQPPGTGGGPGGSRWFSGPPYRIGGQYGVPPPFQATQDWLNGASGAASGGAVNGAGAGWSVGVPHTPLTQVPRVPPAGGGGTTNAPYFGGGPTGPPTQMPPWWQAFQQYAGQRFPWLNQMAGARNWFGPPSPNPGFGGGPTGTGTPGGGTYPRGIY